jgi:DNA-binding MarR family transcriptional regulator
MTTTSLVRAVQRAYPQIWFACHVEHRVRRGADGLTDRDAGILAHLDAAPGQRATDLARHLGIGRPALSAQLKRLAALGLIEVEVARGDARARRIRLTRAGERHIEASSPLDGARVAALLACLPPAARRRAVAGLEMLADAARRLADRLPAKE